MYYNILYGDKIITFKAGVYKYLTEDYSNVPYSLCDYYDFDVTGSRHVIYLYEKPTADKVGVQIFYTGGGELHSSNKVYVDNPSGIAGVRDGAKVASVTYTDLSGRSISKPVNGIFIKTATYSDGSKKTSKVVMK